ncbi:DUF6476 family protein [Oceanicola sp. 502str15]|uniref:DUF6476 family protein n=1 Tax=Oceanicola sp. 502str15 TaxID=2696061 RepID=UPI002095CE5B|nr:DUF6476 family protein [Oceanicola sp. 502str15]MCO6382783.1 hypothetical protein [Oceanicola sp. 502str15]
MAAPENGEMPVDLKWLKRLVTVLTLTMIAGIGVIAVLLIIRLSGPQSPTLPESITLPEGTTAQAFTATSAWYAVVTGDDRILIYRHNGTLLQEITITP